MAVLALLVACSAQALDMARLKASPKWTVPAAGFELGNYDYINALSSPNTIAANESWLVAGAPQATEHSVNPQEGVVQVFTAGTGVWKRRLLLPAAKQVANSNFGAAVAVYGSTVAVGAPGPASSAGAVYLFNASNGAAIKTLEPTGIGSGGSAGDLFGSAVAIAGDWVIVGACNDDNGQGSVYVFNLKTLVNTKVQVAGGSAGDHLGASLAVEGNLLAVGCPGVNNKGAAYLYDLGTTGIPLIKKIQPAAATTASLTGYSIAMHQGRLALGAPQANSAKGIVHLVELIPSAESTMAPASPLTNEHFGSCVALNSDMLLVGSPALNSNRGGAYVFNLKSLYSNQQPTLETSTTAAVGMGAAVAWSGNMAVAAAPGDDETVQDGGSLYLFTPVTRPLPLTRTAAKGDFAAGAPEAFFNTFTQAAINNSGEAAFLSTLTGSGSNGNKDNGMWDALGGAQPAEHNLALKSRMTDGAVKIGSVSKLLNNQSQFAIARASLSGTGINSTNNTGIYKCSGSAITRILTTGQPASPMFGGGVPLSFVQVVQNHLNGSVAWLGISHTLRTGVSSTTSGNDSGILLYDLTTSQGENTPPREGSTAAGTGLTYGQFSGRISCFHDLAAYGAATLGNPAGQAVFQKAYNNSEILVAKKTDTPLQPGNAPFSAFLGETVDHFTNGTLFRATLGAPAAAATNEGLWVRTGANTALIFQKGIDLGTMGLPGQKIAKFISYWQGNGQTLALVQLSGAGTSSVNDQALLLYQSGAPVNGTTTVLLREGDAFPGGKIGVINRVEFDPYYGCYLVLATLTGAATGTDQVLLRGFSQRTLASTAEQPLRRPVTVLRKGQRFDNQPGKIKSITLPFPALPASGVGCSGLGGVLQRGGTGVEAGLQLLLIDFDNNTRQLMQGNL